MKKELKNSKEICIRYWIESDIVDQQIISDLKSSFDLRLEEKLFLYIDEKNEIHSVQTYLNKFFKEK